jgi:hypothetical protein
LAERLMAAIAMEMTATRVPEPRSDDTEDAPPRLIPNFFRVPSAKVDAFCDAVFERLTGPFYQRRGYEGFRDDFRHIDRRTLTAKVE